MKGGGVQGHLLSTTLLVLLLPTCGEVQKVIKLRPEEHALQPVHITLQGSRLQTLHHFPEGRDHWVAQVGQLGKAHHDCQLLV